MPMFIPLVVAVGMSASWVVIAGAALGAIGALTNNKTLSLVGAMVGLAGGFAAGGATLGGEAAAAGAAEGVAEGATTAAATEGVSEGAQALAAGGDVAENTIATAGTTQTATSTPNNVINSPADAVRAADSGQGLLSSVSPTSSPATNSFTGLDAEDAGLGMNANNAAAGKPNDVTSLIKSFLSKDSTQQSLLRGGMFALAEGFKRNPQLDYVDLQRQRLDAEKAELARQIANRNNIPQISLNQGINPNANLYPNPTGNNYAPVGILRNGIRVS